MTLEQYQEICKKYGLEMKSETEGYLPLSLDNHDLIDSFVEYYSNDGSIQYYNGFSVRFNNHSGNTEISYEDIDIEDTININQFENDLKVIMERYKMIIPLLKKEREWKKLKEIENDFK